jgi:Ricin-type beta-trefoil lectin domain
LRGAAEPAVDGAMNKIYFVSGLLIVACLFFTAASRAVQFVGASSGECINLPEHGFTANDGTPVRQLQCRGNPNQQWTINDGQIIANFGSCLDVQGSAPTDGAHIIIVACNGRPSQKWSISNGQIVGIGGKCVDVAGGSTSDTAPLILSTCSAAPSQQWTVQ